MVLLRTLHCSSKRRVIFLINFDLCINFESSALMKSHLPKIIHISWTVLNHRLFSWQLLVSDLIYLSSGTGTIHLLKYNDDANNNEICWVLCAPYCLKCSVYRAFKLHSSLSHIVQMRRQKQKSWVSFGGRLIRSAGSGVASELSSVITCSNKNSWMFINNVIRSACTSSADFSFICHFYWESTSGRNCHCLLDLNFMSIISVSSLTPFCNQVEYK